MILRPLPVEAVQKFISETFKNFGLNKQKEIVRLLVEISRREKCDFKLLLQDAHYRQKDFFTIKNFLLARRFPSLNPEERASAQYLQCDFLGAGQEAAALRGSFQVFNPRNIYVEKEMSGCGLARRFSEHFPNAQLQTIEHYRDFVSGQTFDCVEYNQRLKNVFILKEMFDFFQPCPCSPGALSCGYHIMNAGFGCGYECAYCFLQGYANAPGILFPGNLEEFFGRFKTYVRPGLRLGTGQFTDSLLFDHITHFSSAIIEFFRQFPDVIFEFKTKSSNIEQLLKAPAAENIQISWTLNPQNMIDQAEFGTASLSERLGAARRCAEAGFRVGFHFDPMIIYDGWQEDYGSIIERIFENIPGPQIGWISLGCLRMTKVLRQTIEARFPDVMILNAEQVLEKDGKIRYPLRIRKILYRFMLEKIRAQGYQGEVYLCMDNAALSRELGIVPFGGNTQFGQPGVDQTLNCRYNHAL